MKRTRKLLVGLMAMVMLLGTCLTANADTIVSVASVKAITTTQGTKSNGQPKTVSSTTIYTNAVFEPIKVTYTWDEVTVTATDEKGNEEVTKSTAAPAGVKVTSANRGIVNVKSTLSDITVEENGNAKTKTKKKNGITTVTETQPMKATGTLELTAVSNGKAKITITENTSAKKKKTKAITVTVKTYADDITFGNNVNAAEGKNSINVAVKGKLNLGASIANTASDKKVKYVVSSVNADGTSVAKNKMKNYVTVDGKGNISVKKAIDSAVVTVTSNDKQVEETVTVYSEEAKVSSISFVKDTKSTSAALGMLNKKNVVTLKANASNSAHTYQLNTKLNDGASVEDLNFVSNKPSVATVDENGKITACGNGTAVITATPKLGNSKSAKVTVKVTTDVEVITTAADSFEIIANNKDVARIAAATNSNASNKAVSYKIQSVYDTQAEKTIILDESSKANKTKSAKEIAKYASVDKKGNVKAKQPCIANVVVTANADSTIMQSVTVSAVVPVSTVTIASEEGQPTIKNKKVTVYRTSEYEQQELTLTATVEAADKFKDKDIKPDNTDVYWSSSNLSVASVDDDGTVWVNGNGKTKITATAADRSGKKTTVELTVKTDAYEINVAKAQDDVVYVEGKEEKATNYKLASVIKAATNSDASNKKVAYVDEAGKAFAKGQVALKAGESKTVTIVANDTRAHGSTAEEAKNPITRNITLKCVSKGDIAKSYTVEIMDAEEILLKAGDKYQLQADVTAEEGKVAIDKTTITWKSKSAGIASVAKDGTITAKKPGMTTITASYKYKDEDGKNAVATATVNVYIGRKYADVYKEVNTAINNVVKAENRSYTGVDTKFNTKNNGFELTINNPNKDLTQIKETGLVEAMQSIVDPTYKEARIWKYNFEDPNMGTELTVVTRSGSDVVISYRGKESVLKNASVQDGINFVLEECIGNKNQLKDWNGMLYNINLCKEEIRTFGEEVRTFEYYLNYTVNVTMKEAVYIAQLEDTINANIAEIKVDGIDTVTYNAATNAFEITVNNADKAISQADAESRASVVAAFEEVFADAEHVVLTADTPQGNDVIERAKTNENDTTAYINNLLDEYVNKLTQRGVTTFGQLDGSVLVADVTYVVGDTSYSQSYKVNFYLSEKAFDNMADKAIEDILTGKEFAFGKVGYAADNNTLSVEFNKEYAGKAPIDLAGTGIKAVFEQMIGNTNVKSVVVIVDGKSTIIDVTDVSTDANKILAALTAGVEKNADMADKETTIRVTYASEEGRTEKALVYSVEFSLAEGVEADSLDIEEESTVEETTTEEESTVEETATEEESTEEETATEEESTEEETIIEEESTEEETIIEEESTEEETTTEEESTEEVTTEEEATVEEITTEETMTEEESTVE